MTQLTRRNVLLLAVAMAAATTFMAFLFLTRQQVQAQSRIERTATQTMVVVPRQEIEPLQLLRPEWFTVKQVKADGVPRQAVATPEDLKGKVALVTMEPGEIVTDHQVAAKGPELGLAYAVKPPFRAVTVALDPVIGVAGFPKPGNFVDVLATFNTDYGWVTRTVLQDVKILAFGSEVQAREIDPNSGKASEAKPTIPTATLAVLSGEAEKLILAESRGKLRLALRSAEDNTYRSHTGITKEVVVTGITPQPKNGVTPMTVTKTVTVPAPVRQTPSYHDELRSMPPAPVLPAQSFTSAAPPMPRPEPVHTVTVYHGTQKEIAQFKADGRKAGSHEVTGGDNSAPAISGEATEAR